MKRLSLVVTAAMLLGSAVGWAGTNAFVISVKGTITQKDGTKIAVKDVSKGVSGLVSTNSNILVLISSDSDNVVEIDEVNPATTNIVNAIFVSSAQALLDSGKFNTALVADTFLGLPVTSFPTNIPAFNGDLQADGKVGAKSFGGKLVGVWKDPLATPASAASAAVFKGSISGTATSPVPANCCSGF